MRILVSGVAAFALAAASASAALGQTSGHAMAGCTMMHGSTKMPHCTAASGPVVWYVAAAKTYYLKGSVQYGQGHGAYLCRATAVARGGKPGMTGLPRRPLGGGTSGGGMSGGAMSHPMAPMTMGPRPVPTPMSMPPSSPGPTSSGMGNAAPGSQSSPGPMASTGPTSGNQGNTGAPGAGGQVPNNPAASPSPSPHP